MTERKIWCMRVIAAISKCSKLILLAVCYVVCSVTYGQTATGGDVKQPAREEPSRAIGWQPLAHKDASVFAFVPSQPKTYVQGESTFKWRGEKIKSTRIIISNYENVLTILRFYETKNPKRAWREFFDLYGKMFNTKEVFVRDITLNEIEGKQYEIRPESKDFYSDIRYFFTPQFLIVCEVASRDESDAVAKAVQASFQFGAVQVADAAKKLPSLITSPLSLTATEPMLQKGVYTKSSDSIYA